MSGMLATCIESSTSRPGAAAPTAPQELRVRYSGYNGDMPGPALQVRRGEEVWVRVVNELTEPTAVHWHGVRLINAMDGAAPLTQAPIAPGETFDYRFAAPDAGTFWYRPAQRINARLYGTLTVTEPEPLDIDHEDTLIFTSPGQSDDNKFFINGADFTTLFAMANQRIRLRLLNATVSQILRLRVADLRTFVVATDGQPAQPFVARDGELKLGPGNRIDVFVDWPTTPERSALVTIAGTSGAPAPIAKLVAKVGAIGRPTPRDDPKPLPSNPLPERMDFRDAFRFDAAARQAGKTDAPLFSVKRGRTVMLGLSNSASENAFIHLHGHSFRLLDALDDGWKPFWLDTMPIAPGGKARIAFVADNPGKWPIEGLGDANSGIGAYFVVT
jgi:FtsP/CotA-like multicopper oxidase with cupredoxin domain